MVPRTGTTPPPYSTVYQLFIQFSQSIGTLEEQKFLN